MKLANKYILKLLFSRFFTILLFVILFEFFQEITRGHLLQICSFFETIFILPLLVPYIIFQFLPFIFFLTLITTIIKLYSTNELITLKIIGFSHKKLIKLFAYFTCFIIIFSLLISFIYPKTNFLFQNKKNNFEIENILKILVPNKINKIYNHDIVFSKIDSNNIIHNATIFVNSNNEDSNNKKNKNINYLDNQKEYTIYLDKITFEYNKNNELIAKCKNVDLIINNTNNKQKEINNFFKDDNNTITAFFEQIDILLGELINNHHNKNKKNNYINNFNKMSLLKLIKAKTQDKKQEIEKQFEIQSRLLFNVIIILSIFATCCLLFIQSTNKIKSKKTIIVAIIFGLYLSLSREFFLRTAISNNLLFIYYMLLVLIIIIFLLFSLFYYKFLKK